MPQAVLNHYMPASHDSSLALIQWNILRTDSLRAAIVNRALLVLTADGILLGLAGLAIDKMFSPLLGLSKSVQVIIFLVLLAATVLVLASLCCTMFGALNPFQKGQDLAGLTDDDTFFFNARATIDHCKKEKNPKPKGDETEPITVFRDRFLAATPDEIRSYALGELWQAQMLYRHRYEWLRKAMKFFFVAILVFVLLGCLLGLGNVIADASTGWRTA